MYTVYILYSKTHNKSYIGYSSDMEVRMQYHNQLAEKGYTKRFRPWVIIYTEEFETKAEAMKREKWFKSGVGRTYIKTNILKAE